MMTVYRVVKKHYAADAYSGEGSRLTTGRWHTKGTSICYASTSIALAILEVIVHFQPISTVPELVVVSATIPKDLCTDVYELYSLDSLDNEIKTREIGDSWILNAQSLALKVPSAIVPKEANILINPHHKRIKSVKITETFEFILDRRLLKR